MRSCASGVSSHVSGDEYHMAMMNDFLQDGSGALGESGLPSITQREDALASERLVYGGVAEVEVVRLVVGVLTAAGNAARRDAIRETWGADPRYVSFARRLEPDSL